MISHSFSQFITQHHTPPHPDFQPLVWQLSELTENGSSCLNLKENNLHTHDEWLDILRCDQSGSAVGSPGSTTPLILTPDGKLYLQRYYLFEQQVFTAINHAARGKQNTLGDATEQRIANLFSHPDSADQANATRCALRNRFTIISGGPGTGKTTTVVKILLLLRELNHFTLPTDCLLLAPTGKAADRLRQSILGGLAYENIPSDDFPTETSTIHRALGWKPDSIEFRHNADNPLNSKVVVIDETSMVDLPLMARLLDAIPEDARIILLGDKNQLSSIQVGTVLSDLMDAAEKSTHPIKDCTITLKKSWRTSGPISAACNAIRDGDANLAWTEITESPADTTGAIIHATPPKELIAALSPFVEKYWLPVLLNTEMSPLEKIQAIDQFRILTPTHKGLYGVQSINQTIDNILSAHGIPKRDVWYNGRSVIVQSNDYNLGIYNGDIGLTLAEKNDPADGSASMLVCFKSGDDIKKVPPALLPECATAWALTIHRTQGSEYDHILMIIPPNQKEDGKDESKILSRELLYTGLSRAKKSATLWCTEKGLRQTIAKTVQRASGLSDMFS